MAGRKGGQVWSLEVIIAITAFVIIFVFVFTLLTYSTRRPIKELQSETVLLATTVTQDKDYGFISQGEVDKGKFAEMANMSYEDLKRKMGIKNDFCIFLEDAEGKLISVRFKDDNFSGIGNGSGITIGGVPCGE